MQCCPYHTYCRCIALPLSRGPPCAVMGYRYSTLPQMQHGLGSVYSNANPKPNLRDPLLFKLGPRPALPRARRGGGAPSPQVTGHLSTPYDSEPHLSIKVVLSLLHPYPSK